MLLHKQWLWLQVERKGRATRHSLGTGLMWLPVRWCWVSWECGQQVQKHQLATHVANKCSKRSFTCMHCGFKATYEVVSEKHWPECQNYPVPCPNRCQIGAVERNTLEDHLNVCSLQVYSWMWLATQGALRSFRGKTWRNTLKITCKSTWHWMASVSMKLSQEFEENEAKPRAWS